MVTLPKYAKTERGIRRECVLSLDSFNSFSEAILGELVVFLGCIIGGPNLKNITYTDSTVATDNIKGKLQEFPETLEKEITKKGLSTARRQNVELLKARDITIYEL